MEQLLIDLKQRSDEDWLIGYNSREFTQQAIELYLKLKQKSHCDTPPRIILAERNPIKFLAGFIAAAAANCPIFLCNPDWVESEWQQVFELVQPDLILGQAAPAHSQLFEHPLPITHYQFPHNDSHRRIFW